MMVVMTALAIFFRALHILSAITLLGGAIAWRMAVVRAEAPLALETQKKFDASVASAWRPWALAAIAGLLASGIYNFLNKTGLTTAYHAIFGVKVLLALDIFAAVILATRPDNARRARKLLRVTISGAAIVILSAVLRAITAK